MRYIALKLLWGDKAKFLGLVFGIAFTSFMITFALSYLAGFLTRGFALIDENPNVDIWVMDPSVTSTELTTQIPLSMMYRIKSIEGVAYAAPLLLKDIDIRFENGMFQKAQMIAVDDATLAGVPKPDTSRDLLYIPNSVIADTGGTSDKLMTPDIVSYDFTNRAIDLNEPLRRVRPGDLMLIKNRVIRVVGVSKTIARFPPRILIYTRYKTASYLFPSIRNRTTFILVKAKKGANLEKIVKNIEKETSLRARTSQQFKKDTVRWYMINSEDVGDMVSMLLLAMIVGFGVTGIMLYMFTYENLKQYAILKAIGASQKLLVSTVFFQAFVSAAISVGIGIGFCALLGDFLFVSELDYPFRMMWFAPVVGVIGVFFISFVVALVSIYPVLKMDPSIVFSRR